MKPKIITNNPKVYAEFFAPGRGERNASEVQSDKGGMRGIEVEYHEGMTQEEILIRARDMIHLGAKLVIHPMMGRIKPHETPYKSVFLEMPEDHEIASGDVITDTMSVIIIEDSIAETKKLLSDTYMLKYDEGHLEELQYLDLLLIRSGIEEYR